MKKEKGIKADFNLITILIIPIAIAINFIVGNLVLTLKLPLYLDSIGTFLVAILSGPWVGCVTGFLSIAINSIADPSLFPFAFSAAIAGLIVGFLTRMKLFVNVKRFILSALIVSIVSAIVSIIISIVFFGGFDSSGNSIMIGGMISAGVPFWPAQIIGNFISEVPDKFISLLVPFLVVKRMSERYLYKFSNGSVFIDYRKSEKK